MSVEQTETTLNRDGLELVLNLMQHSAQETHSVMNGLQDGLIEEARELAKALMHTRKALTQILAMNDGYDEDIEQVAFSALYGTDVASYTAQTAIARDWSPKD